MHKGLYFIKSHLTWSDLTWPDLSQFDFDLNLPDLNLTLSLGASLFIQEGADYMRPVRRQTDTTLNRCPYKSSFLFMWGQFEKQVLIGLTHFGCWTDTNEFGPVRTRTCTKISLWIRDISPVLINHWCGKQKGKLLHEWDKLGSIVDIIFRNIAFVHEYCFRAWVGK